MNFPLSRLRAFPLGGRRQQPGQARSAAALAWLASQPLEPLDFVGNCATDN